MTKDMNRGGRLGVPVIIVNEISQTMARKSFMQRAIKERDEQTMNVR